MRLYGTGSISTPARAVLEVFIVIAGLLIAAEVLVIIVLLINPTHPIRQHFQTTTTVAVPTEVWPAEGVVRVKPGIAIARVDPWAHIRYQPASRWFVVATAALSFSWWACTLLMLLSLRRAFTNLSGGTPFPRDNIWCIRRTGLAILGMAAVDLIIDAIGFSFICATTTVAGRSAIIPWEVWASDFPLGTILAGLAVVILAEVFRAGADLQDDQALTV